jgi:hypothetical protein
MARISTLLGNGVFAQFTEERHVVHLQVLPSATPQRGMFPEISHSQALLPALVSVSYKFLFIKLIRRFYNNF